MKCTKCGAELRDDTPHPPSVCASHAKSPLKKLERTYKAVPLKVFTLDFEEYGPVSIIECREEDGRISGLELSVWPGGQEGFERLKGQLVEISLVSMLDGDKIVSKSAVVKELAQ